MSKQPSYAEREAEALAELAIATCLDPASPPEHVAAARARLGADGRPIGAVMAELGIPPRRLVGLAALIREFLARAAAPAEPDE